ncbi:ribonuclease P protein subunit p25 [Microcaecilia unicolor]|uniref:Ribonuclease P protein subunit p25 n=1 Tax=Microcaecilia unicolor TaxID=1415580 RepID=A0A6P7WSQ6_9AMPH|nr:ribonuclease P protein subunit p25 [Microcaecilia unicolor]
MENFRKVKTCEEEGPLPFPGLPAGVVHMKVKEGSKIRNLMAFATARMEARATRQIVFSGCGRAVTKTVTCVEIMKRKLGGLHQLSKVQYRTLQEVWQKQGHAEQLTVDKYVPSICILLSKDSLDPGEPGYQPPEPRDRLWTLDGGLQDQRASLLPPQTEKRFWEPPGQERVNKKMKVQESPVDYRA